MKTSHSLRLAAAAALGLGVTGAHAAGFQLLEQNASGIGNAYAGSAAVAENASTIFFNPAGMTQLPGGNLSAGVTAIKPSFRFRNEGSTSPWGSPATGGSGGDAGSLGVVPNAYLSWQLSPEWFVGLGIGVPFGLMTDYDEGWMNRYHSEEFSIESVNVNPSIAYKASDRLSVGFGVNWMHLDADYRLATLAGVHPVLGPLGDMGTKVKMKGDGWGWNAGLTYQLSPATRLGLSYRSTVKVTAKGTTTLSNRNLHPAAMAQAPLGSHDASATVKLPDTAVLSVVHDLNSRWQLLADLQWTGWSSIKSLDIDNATIPDKSLELKFRDTWRVALGASYRHSSRWTFKGGMAYDQSPIRGNRYRPTALPDNDRIWLSVGAQYRFNDHTTVDVGYAHMFLKKTSIDNDTDPANGVARGRYASHGDLIGVQVSHRF